MEIPIQKSINKRWWTNPIVLKYYKYRNTNQKLIIKRWWSNPIVLKDHKQKKYQFKSQFEKGNQLTQLY
jgi:hypothetical protein